MCGIVGLVLKAHNGLWPRHDDCFHQMLYADALRGVDSTGVIAVENDGAFHIAKEASEAAIFWPKVKSIEFSKRMLSKGKAYIGHNRKKTIGEINDATAHPFVVDKTFAMVHNGTLHSYKHLVSQDVSVDSEALSIAFKKCLDEEDYISAFNETLGKVYGAYATVMYDQKRDTIFFVRNNERPMWFITTDDAYYFASEPMMASWIICRQPYAEYTPNKLVFDELPVDELWSINLSTNEIKKEKLSPKKYQASSIKRSYSGANTTMPTFRATGLSKKQELTPKMHSWFKKRYLGKRLSFWADDFVEKNCPSTIEEGESEILLFGECDDVSQQHTINCEVDIHLHHIYDEVDIGANKWEGIVEAIEFEETIGSARIWLTDVSPMVKSIGNKSKEELMSESLLSKSLLTLQKELKAMKEYIPLWQKDMYEKTIAIKQKEVDKLSHALGRSSVMADAEREGVTLTSNIVDGEREQLIHPTKGVVYESPIVVH